MITRAQRVEPIRMAAATLALLCMAPSCPKGPLTPEFPDGWPPAEARAAVTCQAGEPLLPPADAASTDLPPDSPEGSLLLPAEDDGRPQVFLVILPGAYVEPEAYLPLARTLQDTHAMALWVGIARFAADVPNPVTAPRAARDLVACAATMGLGETAQQRFFLAGHSLGGIMAAQVATNLQAGGLLLFGAYLPDLPWMDPLASYPMPVLTLGGELDGQTWFSRIAAEAVALTDYAAQADTETAFTDKPVVVVEDTNHYHFADGRTDPRDVPSELPLREAHHRLAEPIRDFLSAHSAIPDSARARASLVHQVDRTLSLLGPYLAARTLEPTEWCESAQRLLIGSLPPADPALTVSVEGKAHANVLSLALARPALETDATDGAITITTHGHAAYGSDPMDANAMDPKAALTLACKMKSSAAVAQAMGLEPPADDQPTCREINAAAIAWAENEVSERVLTRYRERGRPLSLRDDEKAGTGLTWLYAKLKWDDPEPGIGPVGLTSTALVTSTRTSLNPSGMHYCKLLSPARAVEWISVESLLRP